MGEAVNQMAIEKILHSCSHSEIHRYFVQIIPYLEQRRVAAKNLYHDYNNRLTPQVKEGYGKMIIDCNEQIKLILDIEPPFENTD